MNCSVLTPDKLFVGTRDRRVYVYNKFSLDPIKTLEVPESVHCMALLEDCRKIAIGMTDGHVMVIGDAAPSQMEESKKNPGKPSKSKRRDIKILNASHHKELGGIWCMCGVNNDTELALGTNTGVHIAVIGNQTIDRSADHYMKGKSIWNISEFDDNKLVCTRWDQPHVYILDRNDPQSLKRTIEIKDPDSANKNITDLLPLPAYDPVEFPFYIKRGLKRLTLVDVLNKRNYTMYEDVNNKWGYNKVSMVDRGEGRFNLLHIVNEGKNK